MAGSLLLIFLAKEGRVGSEGWLSLARGSPCYALSLFILRILYYYGFILGFLFFEGSSADGYLLVSGRSGSIATLLVLPSKIASLSISCSTPQPQISSSFLCIFLFILLQLNRQQTISGWCLPAPHLLRLSSLNTLSMMALSSVRVTAFSPSFSITSFILARVSSQGFWMPMLLQASLNCCPTCSLVNSYPPSAITNNTNYYHYKSQQPKQTYPYYSANPTIAIVPILIILMSKNDNNLLDFLKKNSLFSTPNKNSQRRSKSRSKDKVLQNRLTPNFNQQPYQDPYNHRPFPEPNPNPNQTFVPLQTHNMKVSTRLNDSRFGSFDDLQQKKQGRGVNQVWAGLVSYSTSFESARIESAQCLENLSSRVRNEISSINIKIEHFNSRMYRVITEEFKSLRERLLFVIDESFKEGEKYIREYMKAQEEKLGGELTKVREVLQKEYTKIEGMKEELAKPTWRKTAGDIISNHLEETVEELVRKSSALNLGNWQLGDLIGYRLKDLERDLRAAVRLKRDT